MITTKNEHRDGRGQVYPMVSADVQGIHVRLPRWIEELLFDELGANHRPAGRSRSFDRNLGATRAEIMTYLGTYFPRSLAETFVVFDSLLSDGRYAESVGRDGTVRVCSVGSGTGGDLLGLALALSARLGRAVTLEAVSIEGNPEAHATMKNLFERAAVHVPLAIDVSYVDHVFVAPAPFSSLHNALPPDAGKFDFVLCSKMLNELDGSGVSERPYLEFCTEFASRLSPNGVMMVLDVTSSNGGGRRWVPSLLNGQVNEFLEANDSFKTVLPLLCNRFEASCRRDCYTQNVIHVSYRNVKNECSKICYRVIGHAEVVDGLSSSPALWSCPITRNNENYCREFRGEG